MKPPVQLKRFVQSAFADPAQRHRAITGLATRWLQSDRTAASVWLAHTDLPRDAMQALLAGKPVPGREEDEIVFLY